MSYKDQKILTVITARGGSKRLPGKNILSIAGKPMIGHVIDAARNSKYTDLIIVTTDDPSIAEVSRKHGAEVPFTRPAELSTDTASSLETLEHAVGWMEKNRGYVADIVVLMQPTSPLVLPGDVDETIEQMIREQHNSSVSVCEVSERPEWMFYKEATGGRPFMGDISETSRSQDFKPLFITNGAVYAMKRDLLMKEHKIRDRNSISLYVMPKERSVDIDTEEDLALAEALFKKRSRIVL